MKIPCSIKHIDRFSPYFVYGYLIGVIPSSKYESTILHTSVQSSLTVNGYTSRALVLLETFSKGSIVEIDFNRIKCWDTIKEAKEACNPVE